MRATIEVILIGAVLILSLRRSAFLVATLLRQRSLPKPLALPTVTVLVPAHNEERVAGRLLEALGRLEYPADKLSFIFVCDGCVDGTASRFRAWAAAPRVTRVIELAGREGKAAALNAGLAHATGQLVAVVDADLRPHPDFLIELARPFADERVAAASAFLDPANADDNVVTRYAAVTSWVHQLVTSRGTDRLGLNPPTLGAAAYRRTALDAVGDFPLVAVGVDVAASAVLVRHGWRTRFVQSAVADNLVAATLGTFWRQHLRWGRASFSLLGSGGVPARRSWAQRTETVIAAIGYGDRLVFAAAAVAWIGGLIPGWVPLLYLAIPGVEMVTALRVAGVGRGMPRFLIAALLVFGIDLTASVTAVLAQLTRRPQWWTNPRWISAGDSVP
jgi:GT2 family glycosyltransferase